MVELGVTRPFRDRKPSTQFGGDLGYPPGLQTYKTAGSLRTLGKARNQPASLSATM